MREEQRFRDRAQEAVEILKERFRQYTATIDAVAGFFEASSVVKPEEWTRFITSMHLERHHPGMRSIGYAPLVLASEATVFPEFMSSVLGTNLVIEHSGTNEVLFPTVYLEQFGGAVDRLVGWDAMSETARRVALRRLMSKLTPVLIEKKSFHNDTEPLPGFLVYTPILKRRDGSGEQALKGVVFSSFIPQRLLRGLSKSQLDPMIFVNVQNGPADATKRLARIGGDEMPAHPKYALTNVFTLFGEPITLRVATTPAYESRAASYLPHLVLAGGIFCSMLLFGIAWTLVNARAAAENMNKRLLGSEEQLLRSNRELERTIAEQRTTESLLAHERDLLRTLLDHSPDRIYFKDRESRFLKCGKAVLGRLGLGDTTDAIGKTDFDFFTEEHARAAYEMEQQIIRTGQPVLEVAEKETWSDGRETWVLTSKMPLRDKHGNIIGTFGSSKDITALKRVELELEKEKELLAVTLRSIGDGVITTDTKGRIVLFNKVAEQLTGWTQQEATTVPLREVFRTLAQERRESDTEVVRRVIKSTEIVTQERSSVLIARDGVERNIAESVAPIVDHDGNTIGAVLVFRDITEKLKTEAESLRSSKLESIGVLAGGIAHDFNNILTVILGNISIARMLNESLPSAISNVLNEAEKASLRARDLTQRLLTFAKGGAPIKKAVTLGPLLRDCTKATLQGSNVNFQFYIAEDLWAVNADEGQLAQVLQNLIRNARHAVSATPVIDVHASNIEMATDPLMFLIPGRYVRISIRDHGAGLQEEQLSKIFDPYFSSRKHGGGLELATAYSIVRKHEGQIRVESISGQGTVFHVYLPAATTGVEAVAVVPTARRFPRSTGGHILVMDDEPAIRQLSSTLLHRIGYTAVAVADGAEAVMKYQAARRAGRPFDAVIMDLTIPNGMGGAEAISELRVIDPAVKAIVCSGYSNDPVMANYRDYGFAGVVPKPYNAEDLAVALSELLSGVRLQRDPADVA